MENIEAIRRLRKELDKFELFTWTAELNNRKTQYGLCNYLNKTIYLSRYGIKLNTDEEVMDTILHEIAHALTPGAGHKHRWKAKCVELGARPNRCSIKGTLPKGKYRYGCGECGYIRTYHRKPKIQRACAKCCNKYNNGNYSEDYLLVEMKE